MFLLCDDEGDAPACSTEEVKVSNGVQNNWWDMATHHTAGRRNIPAYTRVMCAGRSRLVSV